MAMIFLLGMMAQENECTSYNVIFVDFKETDFVELYVNSTLVFNDYIPILNNHIAKLVVDIHLCKIHDKRVEKNDTTNPGSNLKNQAFSIFT